MVGQTQINLVISKLRCLLFGLSQAFWGLGWVQKAFWSLLIWTDKFHFVRFFGFLTFKPFSIFQAIFGVAVGFEKFFGVYLHRLITFNL